MLSCSAHWLVIYYAIFLTDYNLELTVSGKLSFLLWKANKYHFNSPIYNCKLILKLDYLASLFIV